MENLDTFRQDTRNWLEANCPEDMRQPMRSDEDQCWGGRNWVFKSEGQKVWLERMAEKGWTAPRWPAADCPLTFGPHASRGTTRSRRHRSSRARVTHPSPHDPLAHCGLPRDPSSAAFRPQHELVPVHAFAASSRVPVPMAGVRRSVPMSRP